MLSYCTSVSSCVASKLAYMFITEFSLHSSPLLSDGETRLKPWIRLTLQLLQAAAGMLLFRLMTFRQHQVSYADRDDSNIRPHPVTYCLLDTKATLQKHFSCCLHSLMILLILQIPLSLFFFFFSMLLCMLLETPVSHLRDFRNRVIS